MASFQLSFRDNPNGSIAVHDHAADTASSDNENQHAEGLNSNVVAHVHAAGDASSDNKDEPAEEAKYSNPANGHFPPQPDNGPPIDLIKEQRGKVKWVSGYSSFPYSVWAEDINVAAIRDVVAAQIHHIGLDKDDFEVEYFAEGSFNKLYTVRKASQPPDTGPEYIFRVCLPVHPWYKLESEVATMELVHMYTNIPVPKVYVYDSDSDNPVRYEWMMMDKMKGTPFLEAREAMNMEQKMKLARTVADWMHQLSTLRFDKIGSIYRGRTKPATSKTDFKVGPIVDQTFMRDWRLEYKLHRGPYTSIEQYLRALIDVNLAEVIDPRQKQRFEFHAAREELDWLTSNADDCSDSDKKKLIMKAQAPWTSQPPEAKPARIKQLLEHVDLYNVRHDYDTETVIHERGNYSLFDVRGNRRPDPTPVKAAQCQALLFAVPHLSPAESLSPSSTVLHHGDVSVNNVLVDPATGDAIALVDWEQAQALPYALIDPIPSALYDKYDMTSPPRKPPPTAPEVMHETYEVKYEFYVNSLMRKEFRQRLEDLGSPYLETFEDKDSELKHLLELANYAEAPFIKGDVKKLVEKLEKEIGRGF
ncbi:putative aminoglycoside phosphotransferase protein [Lasiodiplodia theobromae]|uniref:Aminoglycoside phosphotransferase protein n=1 Tax=Lasiodiplodia theobromae TaxID=45133 RepID=A0A8H7IRG2_9PEZI|nr:putative aminoglycoside phosphotransferase protein [Lasiodiplodia theobromae]